MPTMCNTSTAGSWSELNCPKRRIILLQETNQNFSSSSLTPGDGRWEGECLSQILHCLIPSGAYKIRLFSILISHGHWFLSFSYTSVSQNHFSFNIHLLSFPLKSLILRQTIEDVAIFTEKYRWWLLIRHCHGNELYAILNGFNPV